MGLGQCLVNQKWQALLGVTVGDIVYHKVSMPNQLTALVNKFNARNLTQVPEPSQGIVTIPCKVAAVLSDGYGKISVDSAPTTTFMEYTQFLQLVARYLPTELDVPEFKAFILNNPGLLDEYADQLAMTLPAPRAEYYASSNFDVTQRLVTQYANEVTDALGYYPVLIDLGTLSQMKNYATAVLFMGLIFDIIILLFIIIAVLLIYSLLMISVETKTFEMGVIRMLGLSKNGVIGMVLLQALMFVAPAISLGFILAAPVLKPIYTYLLADNLGISNKPSLDGAAVGQALAIGLFIPLLSAILPIRSILSKNLNDALDYQRSKTQAVYVEVLDKQQQSYSTYIVFGVISILYGLGIYYFLPLSLLSMDFKMILQIFFMILLGMLFGLTLLSFNLQRGLEVLLVHGLLCYEQSSMRLLVLKNLTAHKLRNKMTSIIFSLAIGFIVFLIVSYNL